MEYVIRVDGDESDYYITSVSVRGARSLCRRGDYDDAMRFQTLADALEACDRSQYLGEHLIIPYDDDDISLDTEKLVSKLDDIEKRLEQVAHAILGLF